MLKKGKPKVTITTINVKLHGYMHNLKGMEVKDSTFVLDIPFRNKTHTDMLTEATSFKSQKAEPIKINGIEVAEPFRLVSSEPQTPLEIKADQKIDFKMTIQAPGHNYTGPMSVNFMSDSVELIHIEISKTVLNAKDKKISIETSSRILNLPKGQIFTEKIQLYKGFSFGDPVSRIEVSYPFTFVSSDPKLPLKIDDPNSYIINIFIQAPSAPYAGVLEVKVS